MINPYAPENTAPGSAEIVPVGTSHFTCVAIQVSIFNFIVSTAYGSRFLIFPPASSPRSKRRTILPFKSSLFSFKIFASARSIAVWASCPQAWEIPSFLEMQTFSFVRFVLLSLIGSASISARRRTVFPGFPPWICPIIPPSGTTTYSIPSASSSEAIYFTVSYSTPLFSGYSCICLLILTM